MYVSSDPQQIHRCASNRAYGQCVVGRFHRNKARQASDTRSQSRFRCALVAQLVRIKPRASRYENVRFLHCYVYKSRGSSSAGQGSRSTQMVRSRVARVDFVTAGSGNRAKSAFLIHLGVSGRVATLLGRGVLRLSTSSPGPALAARMPASRR